MWTVQDHLDRLKPHQLKAWLKEHLESEMPLLCIRLEETTAQSLIKWYKQWHKAEMPSECTAWFGLACTELAREFLSAPEAASDYYAGELLQLACGIEANVSDEAHALVAHGTFATLSKTKQVAVLGIIRKQPHDFAWWMELDRRTGGQLRGVIASCLIDQSAAEFIKLMPRLSDDDGADILITILQVDFDDMKITKAPDREKLLQMVRDVLPQCCDSIKRAVAEWFEEEGIPSASVDGSHVSFSAGMGAMCGTDDDNPVYDGSVSLSYADGREIGCAKCRELFVADVNKRTK